jgi:hypothetical protein
MKSARDRWFEMLAAERDRQLYGEMLVDGRDAREILFAELAVMGERLRADPNWREPTPEETAAGDRILDKWFKEFKKRCDR